VPVRFAGAASQASGELRSDDHALEGTGKVTPNARYGGSFCPISLSFNLVINDKDAKLLSRLEHRCISVRKVADKLPGVDVRFVGDGESGNSLIGCITSELSKLANWGQRLGWFQGKSSAAIRHLRNEVGLAKRMLRLVLYQGTTLVGPFRSEKMKGFSPCEGESSWIACRRTRLQWAGFCATNQYGTTLMEITMERISSCKVENAGARAQIFVRPIRPD
jgi:hypothetical protein